MPQTVLFVLACSQEKSDIVKGTTVEGSSGILDTKFFQTRKPLCACLKADGLFQCCLHIYPYYHIYPYLPRFLSLQPTFVPKLLYLICTQIICSRAFPGIYLVYKKITSRLNSYYQHVWAKCVVEQHATFLDTFWTNYT